MPFYVDTSAAVKLVVAEQSSQPLLRWVRRLDNDLVSSDLLRTELLRTTRRAVPDAMREARALLESITLLGLTVQTFERAALLDPAHLRSLDALHLASALEFGDELDGLVCYDRRLTEAAASYGIEVVAPA